MPELLQINYYLTKVVIKKQNTGIGYINLFNFLQLFISVFNYRFAISLRGNIPGEF
jgi:hypothetical protein